MHWWATPNITRYAAPSSSATRRLPPKSARSRWSKATAWRKPGSCSPNPAMTARRAGSLRPTLSGSPWFAGGAVSGGGGRPAEWKPVAARRASQKPPKEGGWNMFFTNLTGADIANPTANLQISASGKNGAWFGWPEDARLEALRDAFARSLSPEEQKTIAAEIQK